MMVGQKTSSHLPVMLGALEDFSLMVDVSVARNAAKTF